VKVIQTLNTPTTRLKYEEAPSFQYLRKPKGRMVQIQKLNDITSRISRHDSTALGLTSLAEKEAVRFKHSNS
jgi:hypothetical protein